MSPSASSAGKAVDRAQQLSERSPVSSLCTVAGEFLLLFGVQAFGGSCSSRRLIRG